MKKKNNLNNGSYFEPIDKSDFFYQDYSDNLDPDEKILIIHNSNLKYNRAFIINSIIIIASILIISFIEFNNLWRDNIIFFIIRITCSFLIGIFGFCLIPFLFVKFKFGAMNYLFTNKKIIIKSRKMLGIINYDNIALLFCRKRLFYHYYKIELSLKNPIENNPYSNSSNVVNVRTIYIEKIDYNDNLIDKLINLIEKVRNKPSIIIDIKKFELISFLTMDELFKFVDTFVKGYDDAYWNRINNKIYELKE